MPRRRALRLLVGLSATLALVLVIGAALVTTVVRRPLPEHEGRLPVPGLDAEVTVLRDELGVPSLYAQTAEDLFRAQGFVHAQDRFFQMDYRRHVTAGRLSELVGARPDALAADAVARALGFRRVAEAEWDLLAPSTREYLTAYADGVNAYLGRHSSRSTIAVEYTVLGTQVDLGDPEPWEPVDSLAWLKSMAWDLRSNDDDELARAQTFATVRDVELVENLFPTYPSGSNLPVLPVAETPIAPAAATIGTHTTGLSPDLQRAVAAAERALAAVPRLVGEGDGTGSNSWVVAGQHTASGAPLLANDPHMTLSAPGVWQQMGLYCTQVTPDCPFEVSGVTVAGFPGVIIGRNADLAWGLTDLGADVTDLFLERVDRDDGTYLREGGQVPLRTRTEVIRVAGGDPVELVVRSTEHGPLISDVVELGRAASSPTRITPRGVPEIAVSWTGLEPGRSADAVFALATAADAEDVAEAAAAYAVPSQNIIFATTDGHIGYQAPGRVPVRATVTDGPVPSDGTWPRPGWDPRYDWQGYVDAEAMPSVLDPPEGFIVAANQAVHVGDGPFLAANWDYGYRAQRIRDQLVERIESGRPVDAEFAHRLQQDTWNPFAAALVPALLSVSVEDRFTDEGVALLREWDLHQTEDSAAAAYFASVWANLLELAFWDDLPQAQWPSGDSRWLAVVVQLLEEPNHAWWDDRRTVNVVESRDEILSRSLAAARLELTVELGKDAGSWQWGRLHTAAPQHPVFGGAETPMPIRRLMNPRPVAVPGGSSVVNATAWDAASESFAVTTAPSVRLVVDLGDPDAGTWVTATGTSGHPGSAHYTDQLEAWAEGQTYPWYFTADAVREASVSELTLQLPSP